MPRRNTVCLRANHVGAQVTGDAPIGDVCGWSGSPSKSSIARNKENRACYASEARDTKRLARKTRSSNASYDPRRAERDMDDQPGRVSSGPRVWPKIASDTAWRNPATVHGFSINA